MSERAADEGDVYRLSPEERADIEEAEAEVARGDILTDDEAAAFLRRLGI